MAAVAPSLANIATTRTSAQKPNTTSTSPSRCHSPAWAGRLCARRSKSLLANVCRMARAKSAAPIDWIAVGTALRLGAVARGALALDFAQAETLHLAGL